MLKFETKKRGSLVTEVCNEIRAAVQSGKLQDGEWLPSERELASQLQISRTVVREATKQLESEGFLEIRHGKGIRVVQNQNSVLARSLIRQMPLKNNLLEELIQVRRLMEPEIAALAAANSKKTDLAKLRDCQDRLLNAENANEAAVIDMEFHKILLGIAGNHVLEVMMDAVSSLSRESRELTLGEYGISVAYRGHEAILEAVIAKDTQKARLAMVKHLETAAMHLKKGSC